MANCNMVGQWAKAENFYEWQRQNLICWGGLTAGDWQYIGSQGVIQGTYEILMRVAERHFGSSLAGRFILTAGLGGMGGAQPLAGTHGWRGDPVRRDRPGAHREAPGQRLPRRSAPTTSTLRSTMVDAARRDRRAASIGLLGNAAEIYETLLARGIIPDVVTDQTSAHDLVYGYVPAGRSLADVKRLRQDDPDTLDAREPRQHRAPRTRHAGVQAGRRRSSSTMAISSAPTRGTAASRRRSTSKSSPKPIYGRCSRGPLARSAGSRSPTTATTSAKSTITCSRPFPTTRS